MAQEERTIIHFDGEIGHLNVVYGISPGGEDPYFFSVMIKRGAKILLGELHAISWIRKLCGRFGYFSVATKNYE